MELEIMKSKEQAAARLRELKSAQYSGGTVRLGNCTAFALLFCREQRNVNHFSAP
jgi:hypothetical protein